VNGASSGGNIVEGLLVWVVLIGLYWLPSIVARQRRILGLGQVVVVNAFLGWTGLGWVVALVMALRHVPPEQGEVPQ
jgi:hypothetical protein